MTYTQLALLMTVLAILFDLFVTQSKMVTRKSFWNAYSIMLFFQLITNWWLTSRGILTYDEEVIIGTRIAAAPIEDLFFGFSMITMTISLWIYWARKTFSAIRYYDFAISTTSFTPDRFKEILTPSDITDSPSLISHS